MDNSEDIPKFYEDRCNLCGKCFNLCPVLKLPIKKAKKEIKNLIENKKSKLVLSKCNTCFSCNLICPQKANPYQLILERWNDLYRERGAPALYRFACPTEDPNIWQLMNIFLSNEEKKWIKKWMIAKPNPNDEILLIGNYLHLFPFILTNSKILQHFKAIDPIDHWEAGAYLYQGGYLDVVMRIATKVKEDFDDWGVKIVIPSTDSVEYMLKEVHQKVYGIKYNQEIINFEDWLLEKIVSDKIKLLKSLNFTVTVHDNCYSKVLNGKYWEAPREILKRCGCSIIEMEHIKEYSLCCGFGAAARDTRNILIPFNVISEGIKKFKEAERTGAKALVSYCSGCIYLLWATRELLGSKIDVYHLIEIVRMAMGEKLNYPKDHINRAWDVISIITYQLVMSLFQKRFFIKNLSYDNHLSAFKPKQNILLRVIRKLFNFSLIRKVYSKVFQISLKLLK